MLKLAKRKGERGKEHKGAKAATRFIFFLSPAVPAQGHGLPTAVCATLLGQAQMRQPHSLEQMLFLKCECKLGHAWTEPEGHG